MTQTIETSTYDSTAKKSGVAPLVLSVAVFLITVWATGKGIELTFRKDVTLAVTFLAIGLIAFWNVVRYSLWRPFSLQLVHWIFVLTFFFIAPVAQYGYGELPWGLSTNLEERLLPTNYLILTWVVIWTLLARPPKDSPGQTVRNSRPWDVAVEWKRFHGMRLFLLLAAVAFVLDQIATRGVNGLFLRGAASDEATITTSSIDQLVDYGGRSLPLALMVLVVTRQRARGKSLKSWPVIGTMLVVLITNFPFATARFWSALVIIGALATFGALRRRWSLTSTILLGLGIGLPVLGAARHATNTQEFMQTLTSSGNNQAWLTPDFDAYSVLTFTHEYTSSFGVVPGRQLLTSLLFFVPRSVWPGKSVGSGYLIAHQINLPFDNVSNTLPAEGLINFGVFGLIIFAVVSALACSALDRMYWTGKLGLRLRLLYPFLLGAFFFILRGDMLSSMSYTVGLSVPMLIVLTLARGKEVQQPAAEDGLPDETSNEDVVRRHDDQGLSSTEVPELSSVRAARPLKARHLREESPAPEPEVAPAPGATRAPGEFGWGDRFEVPGATGNVGSANFGATPATTSRSLGSEYLAASTIGSTAAASLSTREAATESDEEPALAHAIPSEPEAPLSRGARLKQFAAAASKPLSYAGFMGIAQLLSAVFFVLAARRQGPATTAEFMSCYTVAAFISTFIDFGESTNAVRLLAEQRGRFNLEYIRYAGARLVLAASLAVLGLVIAQFQPFVGCALALGAMMGGQVFFVAAVRIRTGPVQLAMCFIVEKCVSIALLFTLSGRELPTYRPIYYLCGGLLANILACMMFWPMSQILRHARPSRAAWFGGRHMGMATIINRIQLMDVAALTALGPRSAAGAYAAVNRWGAPFNVYSQSVAQYMLPHYASADSHHAASGLLRRTNLLLAPASVVLVLVSFVSPTIVNTVLGPKYHNASMALSVLCYGYIAAMYASSYYVFVQARHLDKFAVKIYAISTVIQFAALYPAVHFLGTAGASASFLLGQVILMIGCRRLVARHVEASETVPATDKVSENAEENAL